MLKKYPYRRYIFIPMFPFKKFSPENAGFGLRNGALLLVSVWPTVEFENWFERDNYRQTLTMKDNSNFEFGLKFKVSMTTHKVFKMGSV